MWVKEITYRLKRKRALLQVIGADRERPDPPPNRTKLTYKEDISVDTTGFRYLK